MSAVRSTRCASAVEQDRRDQGADLAADGDARRLRHRRRHAVGGLCDDLQRREAGRLHVVHRPRSCSPTSRRNALPTPVSRSNAAWSACALIYEMLDTKPTMDVNPDGPDLKIERGEVVFRNVDLLLSQEHPGPAGSRFPRGAGQGHRAGRAVGSGKSTIISLIERFYDVTLGRDRHRRPGYREGQAGIAPRPDRPGQPGHRRLPRDASARTSASAGRARPTQRSRRQPQTPWRTTSSWRRNAATTPCSRTADRSSPAASASGSPSPAPCCAMRAIILLDEATSSLDSESEHQVQMPSTG